MKIYLDYVFFINFLFDFILIIFLSILLKHNTKLIRIILSSLFGGISMFVMFLNISSLSFFILKMLLGIVMVIIAFGFKNFKYTFNNFFYLMILSIILGGGLYLLNVSRGYSNSGLVFFANGKKSNLFILLIVSVIVLFFYVRKLRKNKDIDLQYKVQLYDNGKVVDLVGFLDTGNCLSDPFFKKPILIINKEIYSFSGKKILVPFNTINGDSIMECFIVDKVYISNRGFFNKVLVGISPEKFKISGVDIILNKNLWEDLWKRY